MSRLGFANIYELLDESDSSGVETGKKAQVAFESQKAAAAAALAPTPKPAAPQGQKPAGERRQGGNFNGERGPRTDRPRDDRPRGDRPPREDRPRDDRPRGDRPPREDRPPRTDRPPRAEGAEGSETQGNRFPREQKTGGPRPDRGYERRPRGEQDQRPGKREYDRKSGTGRGKEAVKGGSGKGNWGAPGDETEGGLEGATTTTGEESAKEGADETAAATTETATEPAAPAEPVEEEPAVRTLDDYLKEKQSKTGSSLLTARQAGEGEDSSAWNGFAALQKEEESLFAVEKASKDKKANKAKESTNEKKVAADQVLRFQQERRKDDREDRPRRDGPSARGGRDNSRGTPRPQAGQGQKRGAYSAPNFGDASAFPTLSTKA